MIKQFVCILGSWTRIQNVNVTITSIRSSRFLTTTISNNSSNTGASTVTSSRAASVPVATIHPMDNAKMQRLFHHNIEVPTAMDLRVIAERQLESNVDGIIGVEAGRRRHGYPRAFVRQPITESFINSGFMRLSCPYLVKEIDQLELTTGVDSISQLNALVAKSTELQQSFVTINQGHEHIRRELLVDDPHYQSLIQRIQEVEAEVDVVEATVGEESKLESTSAFTSGRITSDGSNSSSSDGYKENGCGNNDSNSTNNSSTNNPKSNHSLVSRIHANSVVGMRRVVDQIVNSGITGITLDKVDDVKCVHAQLADVLCRSSSSGSSSKHNSTNSNGSSGDGTVDGTSAAASISSLAPALTLGDTILAHLAANNVDISGCEACKHQCDVSRPKEAAEFWYQPSKNKLGNRKTRNQRRIDNQKQMRHHQNQV